jgi:hypothetical protein
MTNAKRCGNIDPCTTVLSADPLSKEDRSMDQQKITILYCRLSNEDMLEGESNSVQNQDGICQGYFRPKVQELIYP